MKATIKRAERFLLVCYFDPNGIETVIDNIQHLKTYSQFSIEIFNLFGSTSPLSEGRMVNLDRYDGIILHNTISYNPVNLEAIDQRFTPSLKDFDGVKVMFKQDEQYRSGAIAGFIGSRRFDLILSCMWPEERHKMYPEDQVGNAQFMQMLTGYVTPKLRARKVGAIARDIDISYRGSLQPLCFGRLAYDKRTIGDDVIAAARGKGLTLDISSRWEDRLMGDDWFNFLARSKVTLGVESGASIFDFDGEVEALCRRLEADRERFSNEHEYSEWVLKQLEPYEGNVYYNQISPRHFEAGAARALQVMHDGRYSDIFKPWQHFIPLNRDMSNFDQVCEYVRDEKLRGEIVDRVYDEIIANPRYSMQGFVAEVDERLDQLLLDKPRVSRPVYRAAPSADKNALLICAHVPKIDPRVAWVADYAPAGMRIHVMGVDTNLAEATFKVKPGGTLESVIPRVDTARWRELFLREGMGGVGLQAMARLQMLCDRTPAELATMLGGPPDSARSADCAWLCAYLLRTNAALIDSVLQARGVDAIVVADFEALPAGAVLKEALGVPLIYDAHEFWPTSLGPDAQAWEVDTWHRFEQELLQVVDAGYTVSPGLAAYMAQFYGKPFEAMPNCEPLAAAAGVASTVSDAKAGNVCTFLFQGNFAAGRGLELLIKTWPATTESAHLLLRGPDRPYKQKMIDLARATGLLDRRIFFPDAVDEEQLVGEAAKADVGVIPYEPAVSVNNKFCSPNKLSQYMAAQLPILANNLAFVGAVIAEADAGKVVDFADSQALAQAVDALVADRQMRLECGLRAGRYFREKYHWEAVSAGFYRAVERCIDDAGRKTGGRFEMRPPMEVLPDATSPANVVALRGAKAYLYRVWNKLPYRVQDTLRPSARALLRAARRRR
ncbi:glycosyltransferase [Bordetella parapertussis]|uniref:WbmJ n=1 Tax=Bordetella parapertussis TaxID=519 RepID=Q09SL4_BORPP|nr:glycosyltransferase [Bordetella parapertussis]ABF72480.1 WbmJ [Bordetella parapertussis]